MHVNSIEGAALRQGRRTALSAADVSLLLCEIVASAGGVTMHRIVRDDSGAAALYLEPKGMRAMLAPEDVEVGEGRGGARPLGDAVRIVSLNVDGLGAREYGRSAAARVEEMLTHVLREEPDVVVFQEVVVEMYAVMKRRMAGWSINRRSRVTEDYFNVTAVRAKAASEGEVTTSDKFETSQNGRHIVTVRRSGWAIVNVHAESGRRASERDARARPRTHARSRSAG